MTQPESAAVELAGRKAEWFVPRFGPERFRVLTGLLFLPYTGMVLAFAAIGSVMAGTLHWQRVAAIVVIYFFGLGVAAHALDAIGSKRVKPWGTVFSMRELWLLTLASLVVAYSIAVYYIVFHSPWLGSLAIIEGFFVFAYNLEWFSGRFHTDGWFAFSWGFLPVLAGCLIQINTLTFQALLAAGAMALFSLIEIKASRPYKELKRASAVPDAQSKELMDRYEIILKCVSLGVILLGIGLIISRIR